MQATKLFSNLDYKTTKFLINLIHQVPVANSLGKTVNFKKFNEIF